MRKFTRRDFLRSTGAGIAMLGLSDSWATDAWASTPTYTGVTYLTPAYKDLFPPIAAFVERLKKHPDLMKVDFFDSGTLVKTDEQVSALRAGTIQFMFHTTSYITRNYPILGLLGLPSLCEDLYEHGERLAMEGPLWKLINDVLAKSNTFMLTAGGGILEPEYIWSGSNKIASLADLKGKRIRTVSFEAEEVLKPYGVGGSRIPSSELYLAVQRGTVDATLANISTIMGRKIYEQVKYCYKLPMTGFSIAIFFLKDKWDQMPDKVKAAFWDAGKEFDRTYAAGINQTFYPKEFWPHIEKVGIKIFQPTKEELKDFEEKSGPVWAWWKKEIGEEVGQKAINLAMGRG
ncbi:MAG: TRAP transporter substrate-binding protein DctP [Desulfobacterales bacterium]|jgi:TRAP-type C4-dicarboxylate transport system substrate-binding protein|nr:TRAP transporter substrate-binding protein DctP [Desulfobacterales bacterium]